MEVVLVVSARVLLHVTEHRLRIVLHLLMHLYQITIDIRKDSPSDCAGFFQVPEHCSRSCKRFEVFVYQRRCACCQLRSISALASNPAHVWVQGGAWSSFRHVRKSVCKLLITQGFSAGAIVIHNCTHFSHRLLCVYLCLISTSWVNTHRVALS